MMHNNLSKHKKGLFLLIILLVFLLTMLSTSIAFAQPGAVGCTNCEPTPKNCPYNCTYTQGYWKNHPENWPVETITIGGVTYGKAEAIAILNTPPKGDATYILAHQLIAAKLNIAKGAVAGPNMQQVIARADTWLKKNPLGSNPADPARKQGIKFADLLAKWNEGIIGPGHCEE
jgi:hypothetical protein